MIINPLATHQVLLSESELQLIDIIRADAQHYAGALRHLESLENRVQDEISTENSFAAAVLAESMEKIDTEMTVERMAAAS